MAAETPAFGWPTRALLWLVESTVAGLFLWLLVGVAVANAGVDLSLEPSLFVGLVSPFFLFYNVDRLVQTYA